MDTVHDLESDEDVETTVERSASLLLAAVDDFASDNDALSCHACEDSKCIIKPRNDNNAADLRSGNDDSNLGKPTPVKSPGTALFYGLHGDERGAPLAADGRNWKKRHPKLHGNIGQVVQTKEGTPTQADVQKTAAATPSGLVAVVPYMTAYRALTHETSAERAATLKNVEMIISLLEALKS